MRLPACAPDAAPGSYVRRLLSSAIVPTVALWCGCGRPPRQLQPPANETSLATTTPAATVSQPPATESEAVLAVDSDPPGAAVFIGLQSVNGVVDPNSGRFAGTTPCSIILRSADVSAQGGIGLILRKQGYSDHMVGLSDGANKIAQRGTYTVSKGPIKLRPIGE